MFSVAILRIWKQKGRYK